jgi:hypothetical protein
VVAPVKNVEFNKSMKDKEVVEFFEVVEYFKMIKYNTYNIMDQLKKISARISLLSLILSLETHRKAL